MTRHLHLGVALLPVYMYVHARCSAESLAAWQSLKLASVKHLQKRNRTHFFFPLYERLWLSSGFSEFLCSAHTFGQGILMQCRWYSLNVEASTASTTHHHPHLVQATIITGGPVHWESGGSRRTRTSRCRRDKGPDCKKADSLLGGRTQLPGMTR